MKVTELKQILDDHKKWLNSEGGKRTNLGCANLRDANLRDADLRDANLEGADLRDANLSVKYPPVNDHTFISEVLYRKAETDAQKDFAARVRMEMHEYWESFIALAKKKRVLTWAKDILFQWEEFKAKVGGS